MTILKEIRNPITKLSMKASNDGSTTNQYVCDYCGYVFVQKVRTSSGEGGSKKQNCSTQVRCNKCKNFLKTWK